MDKITNRTLWMRFWEEREWVWDVWGTVTSSRTEALCCLLYLEVKWAKGEYIRKGRKVMDYPLSTRHHYHPSSDLFCIAEKLGPYNPLPHRVLS